MIRVTWQRSPFDAYDRERWIEPWSDRATVRRLIPTALAGADPAALRVVRNGQPVTPDQWGHLLGPDDRIEIGLLAAGPFAFAGAQAAGSLLAQSAAAVALKGALISISISTALSALVGALFRQKPPKKGDQESPTYGFGGVSVNPAHANAAFPFLLGEMRVAGPFLNVYTDVLSGGDEWIHILMMVAGHEVHSIGGITDDEAEQPFTLGDGNLPVGLEIDGEPAENFNEVEVHVRLGRIDQELIPGFAAPTLQYAIEREIRESEEPSTVEQTPGVYAYDASEITIWDTPVGVTTEVEADAFTLLVRFEGGLYRLDSNSTEPKLRTVRFQARYRRAKNGKPFGDYVVLPAFDVTAKKTTAFTYAYARDFLDPATFVEPAAGYYLDLRGAANDVASSASVTLSADAAEDAELTVLAWVRLENYYDAGVSDFDANNRIAWHFASNQGFTFSLIGTSPLIGTTDLTAVTIRAGLGNGTSVTNFDSDTFAFLTDAVSDGKWAQIGFTYKADVKEDGSGELLYYCNGKHLQTKKVTSAQRYQWPTAVVIAGAANTAGSQSLDGSIDELLIYERALSSVEIAAKYQGGAPEPAIATETGIVAGWHFDATNTGGTTTPDFVGSADMTLTNGANISSLNTGTDTGPVYQASSGDIVRDRFLVEVQRITALDDADFNAEAATLGAVQLRIYDQFEYPNQALLALRLRATGQTSGVPAVSVPARGYKDCPIWDGVSTTAPTFDRAWSRNPAWLAAAVATDTKLGAGNIWKVTDIDWERFGEAAAYYDELVAANDEQDENGEPAPLLLDILDIDVFSAATAVGMDAVFTAGLIQFEVDDGDWPENYPGVFDPDADSIASDDAEVWFQPAGIDASGVPSAIADLEGVKLAVGRVTFTVSGGGPGMGMGSGGGSGSGPGGGTGGFIVWCHTPADPGADTAHTPGTGEVMTLDRWERRMECDITLDRIDMPRWDALLTILKSARATPLPQGRKLSLWYDAPRDVDNVLGMGSTVAGTFATTYSGVADRPNVIEGTFLDRDRGYEQVPVQARHPDVVNPSVLTDQRVAQESFEGITRRTQLERHLRYKLNWYNLARRMYEAEVGVDLLDVAPGHRLRVSHDAPGWGYSGRMITEGSTTTVKLDQAFTLATGETWQVQVRDTATKTIETRTVSSGPGTYAPGDAITVSVAFSFIPQKDDVYIFGEQEKVGMDYLVVETALDTGRMTRSIRAVQYDAQVYTDGWGDVAASISYLTPPEVPA